MVKNQLPLRDWLIYKRTLFPTDSYGRQKRAACLATITLLHTKLKGPEDSLFLVETHVVQKGSVF